MQISLIGTHGTGKTTAVSQLHSLLSAKDSSYAIINGITRHCPFAVGKSSNKLSQDWVMNTQKYFEDNCSNLFCPIITDRNMIDQYAYYIYWAGKNKIIENELMNMYSSDDRIYFMPINPAYLVSDGLRPIDVRFQEEINTIILHILDDLKIYDYCNVIPFNENSISDIVDAVRSSALVKTTPQKVTNAKYSYENKIFEKVVLLNNIPMDNISPEYFDDLFYKMIILLRR